MPELYEASLADPAAQRKVFAQRSPVTAESGESPSLAFARGGALMGPFSASTSDPIGTDTGRPWRMTGFNMHEALEETVRAGLTPMEAITAATASSARLLRQDGQWGTIAPNNLADLVLLDANPLDQIGNTRRINAVVINGRLLDRQALDAMLAELETANAD